MFYVPSASGLQRVRGSVRSAAKDLRRLGRDFGQRRAEPAAEHSDPQVPAVFPAQLVQDPLARAGLRQPVHHQPDPGPHDPHRRLPPRPHAARNLKLHWFLFTKNPLVSGGFYLP